MPTNLPIRYRTTNAGERRTLLALVAMACAFMGLTLIEPVFTDTAASAEVSNPFSDIAEY